MSVDSRVTGIFKELFHPLNKEYPLGNEGQNHGPEAEMHLLYGLADTIATIISLTDRKENNGRSHSENS